MEIQFAFLVLHFKPEEVSFGHSEMFLKGASIVLDQDGGHKGNVEKKYKENTFMRENDSLVITPLDFSTGNSETKRDVYEIPNDILKKLLPYLVKNNDKEVENILGESYYFASLHRRMG